MKYLILATSLIITSAYGAELEIEPVYGFERSFQQSPQPSRYKTEVFTGVKFSYGNKLIAGEAEINQGHTTYTVGDTDVKTTTQNLLLGLRLTPLRDSWYSVNMRGGIRARKESREIDTTTGSTTKTDAVQYDPYAGGGVSIHFSNIISLNASVTLIYNRDADPSEQYDSRYTLGGAFKFGSSTNTNF